MRTLLNLCASERRVSIPPGFFRNGWNMFLPKGICSLLLSVTSTIIQGLDEKEILLRTSQEGKMMRYAPFNFRFPTKFSSENEKNRFLHVLDRETRVSKTLEKSGVGYPINVKEEIELLLYLGLLLRVRKQDMMYLDVLLDPYPYPEDLLHLTADEKYQMMLSRQNRSKNLVSFESSHNIS